VAAGLTDVRGILVGHHTDRSAATGCTVVLCPDGAIAGVSVRGGAPGTRETDLLRPGHLVERVHAVLLSGGSAFGLAAADGVVRYLEEQGVGFKFGNAAIPVVPAAILFDLGLVTSTVRPGPQEGYQACLDALDGPVEEGSVGAGTGATLAKALGMARAVKGGIGTASVELGDGLLVAALVAVNAYGDVYDYRDGRQVAGPRRDGGGFHSTLELLRQAGAAPLPAVHPTLPPTSTTIGVVATNATLTKEQAVRLAEEAQDGLALAIRPCHTLRDGDTLFALATGQQPGPVDAIRLGAAAVEAVALAVLSALEHATGLGGVPAVRELRRG
jgi:L-aminopeptidase/D-esterase-like protein